jgi:erythromycin esterase
MVRALVVLVFLFSFPLHAQRTRAVRSHPLDTPGAWLRHRAIAIDDTQRLLRVIGGARVVAFGDVTHGTRELDGVRLRVIPRLIDDGGFRIIAVEAPYAQWAALDEYVRTGNGDPAALLRNDPYFFWDTQEMLDLLRWARARNASGIVPPIRVAGLDATEAQATGRHVVAKLKTLDAQLAAFAEFEYGCLPRCNDTLLEVRKRIEARPALFASAADYDETVHAARVVEQGVIIDADFFGKRDPMMAENVLWLAARGKVVMIGHNEHWSRIDYLLGDPPRTFRSAGADLVAALGSDYFAIGSVVHDGTFYAVDPQQRRVRAFEIGPPLQDDWSVVLNESGLETVIVPLFAPFPQWLTEPRRIRFAGSSAPVQTTDAHALAAKFDAVLFVRTSTPSSLLHFPLF